MVEFIVKPKSEYIDPDKKLSGMCCAIPFRHLEIHPGGDTSICCLTFLPEFTGNILQDGPERILDRKSTRLNSSHSQQSRMPSSA